MDLAQQPVGQREATAQPFQAVLKGRHIVGDLDDVCQRHAGGLIQLEQQQVGERRLGTLDLGGQHRLLPHVRVEEQGRVRQDRRDAIQPSDRERRRLQGSLETRVPGDRGLGREWSGHERTDPFATYDGDFIPP